MAKNKTTEKKAPFSSYLEPSLQKGLAKIATKEKKRGTAVLAEAARLRIEQFKQSIEAKA